MRLRDVSGQVHHLDPELAGERVRDLVLVHQAEPDEGLTEPFPRRRDRQGLTQLLVVDHRRVDQQLTDPPPAAGLGARCPFPDGRWGKEGAGLVGTHRSLPGGAVGRAASLARPQPH